MQYKIVGERSAGKFTKLVNDLIAEGWKPQGGVCVVIREGQELYAQAMIRTPSLNKPKP